MENAQGMESGSSWMCTTKTPKEAVTDCQNGNSHHIKACDFARRTSWNTPLRGYGMSLWTISKAQLDTSGQGAKQLE